MQRVIVTGGAGFIGSNLVDNLIQNKKDVIILDNFSTGKEENVNPKAELIVCDVATAPLSFLKKCMKNVDVIFHMASRPSVQYSIDYPLESNKENIDGTLKILLAAKESKVKRVVFSSSSAIYGEPEILPITEETNKMPMSPYALQKWIGEQYCKLFSSMYKMEIVCLRYFNVFGERMNDEGAYRSVISVFLEQRLKGQPLNIVNDGEQTRDFVYVGDVVEANLRAAITTNKEAVNSNGINISGNTSTSVNEIAKLIGGEKKYGETRIEPKQCLADNKKAKNFLGWTPRVQLKTWINNYKKVKGL